MKQSTTLSFRDQDVYVGLDVHVKSWNVSVLTDAGLYKSFNQPPDPQVLVHYLERHFPQARYHCVYEAGYSGFWIYRQLRQLGVDASVVNPADVPTTDKERTDKSDRVDACKLGQNLRDGRLTAIYVPSRRELEDRSLVRTRRQLVRKQTRVKNQIKAYLRFYGIVIQDGSRYWSRALIRWLEQLAEGNEPELAEETGRFSLWLHLEELKALRNLELECVRHIRRLSRTDHYRDRVEWLVSLSGIGLIGAMTLLTELVDIDRFRKVGQLYNFVGLVPSRRSSGDYTPDGELTRRGNRIVRHVIIESAWVAARKDPSLCAAYLRLCKRMRKSNAIVRIARKQLARVNYVLKNECTYNPLP